MHSRRRARRDARAGLARVAWWFAECDRAETMRMRGRRRLSTEPLALPLARRGSLLDQLFF